MRLRDDDAPVSELVPVQGVRLNYRLEDGLASAERVCIGHVPFRQERGAYHDCLRPPEKGSRTCQRCRIVEATLASNLHHAHTRGLAELDPAIRDHLHQPNRLYLAGFRDGSIKVGTTTVARAQTRLEEQGAWSARFVAETDDGIAVRSLEDLVTEVWSISQSVSATRKVKGLVSPVADEQLDAALDNGCRDVAVLVERSDDARVRLLTGVPVEPSQAPRPSAQPRGSATAAPEPGLKWRHPMIGNVALSRVHAYPLKLTSGTHDLTCIGAVGRILLVQRPTSDDVFAVDPAPLFGLRLDVGEYGSDEIAIQDSLF